MMKRVLTLMALTGGLLSGMFTNAGAAPVTAAESRSIAKEAFIYGYPLVDAYRIFYAYFVNESGPEFKAPWNQIRNIPRTFTPDDKAIQTPNSDTPYSFAGLDLRSEPIVLTLPVIEKGRYFSVQLIDLYTHNFGYLGSRTTGNGGGSYLIAGPDWKGATPPGIKKVLRSETQLIIAGYRTQLMNPDDLDNVKKIQAGYKVQTLSAFLGEPAPPQAPTINFIPPLAQDQIRTSPQFFSVLNFVLQFCPTVPSERALMTRFAKLDIGPGKTFDADKLPPDEKQAVADGMAAGWKTYEDFKTAKLDTGKVTSGDLIGNREYLKNNYLYRMAFAVIGIFGNSKAEAMYPLYTLDANGEKLEGANRYTLHFAPGQYPPANAFWSLTMYELPASLLVANPLNRYLINSAMLPTMKRDADGGLTLYIQHDSPGKDEETNWLPAPSGPFLMFMRIYWPKPEALDGKWKAPPVKKAA